MHYYAPNRGGTLSLTGHSGANLRAPVPCGTKNPAVPLSGMAIKVPWKVLSKGDTFSLRDLFSSRRGMFFAAAGLVVVAGLVLRVGLFSGEPDADQKAPVTIPAPASPAGTAPATAPAPSAATAPASPATPPAVAPAESVPAPSPPAQEAATKPAEQTGEAVDQSQPAGEAVEQTGQAELPDAGMVLVSRQPVEVLSGPSATASVMYGFPAGRRFTVIGREGGFAQIKDVDSGASGWINEAALAPPPSTPAVSSPSQSRPVGRTQVIADPKPKATRKPGQSTAGSEAPAEPAETRRRPGLFGGDGPFRGIFGGGN